MGDVDNAEDMWEGKGVYWNSLSLHLDFAVNRKPLLNNKVLVKEIILIN